MCYKFLADYCLKQGKLDEAHQYAQFCSEFDETKEHGKGVLRKIAEKRVVKCKPEAPEEEKMVS